MKKYFLNSAFALVVALSVVSCEDEKQEDTVNPEIIEATIDGEDHDVVVNAGEQMTVAASLSDNEELGELKIDIHDVFDGHTHKSSASWAEVTIVSLSGTSQDVSENIAIPTDATAGPYHATFRVLDKSGNEGEFVEIPFMLSNGSEPEINITSPDFTDHVHVSIGSTLVVEGMITDDVDLAEIYVVLEEEHDDDHDHKSTQEDALYEMDFDLEGASDLTWDFQIDGNVNIAIPATAEEGHYVLTVRAEDSEGNINIFEAELHIM